MAKFRDTANITACISNIIKRAEERLILISPYLNICKQFRDFIQERDMMRTVDIKLIYRVGQLTGDMLQWVDTLNSAKKLCIENLHAKCYLNEKEALITSMNLYEFSQLNNLEMGIYVSRETDPELYNEINKEVMRIIRGSREEENKIPKSQSYVLKKKTNHYQNKTKDTIKGFCIRCSKRIKLNPEKPYCSTCFSSWNEYGNEEYNEKFCHSCGKQNKSTIIKPVCISCYRRLN